MPPLVSIIVNSFNYAPYVGTAIESVLGQGYERIEVIVVDDGSTDGSADVIAGYQDRAQTLLKPNGGQASALNAGFAASTGDIVIFVDSDDLLYPHAVSSVVAAWVPECAKVQYRLAIVDEHCPTDRRIIPCFAGDAAERRPPADDRCRGTAIRVLSRPGTHMPAPF